LNCIGGLLELPALPIVYILLLFHVPLPLDETKFSPWDYLYVIVAIIVSALFWGFIAGFLSRHFLTKRGKDF
jgi:hypothetical protein